MRRLLWVLILTPLLIGAAPTATIRLQWDPSAGAVGYRVYYGESSGVYHTVVNPGPAISASIGGLRKNRRYYFAATAYDDTGNESGYSNEVNEVAR